MNIPLLDPYANWCPDCGEPRGVCCCEDVNTKPMPDYWELMELEDELDGRVYEPDDPEDFGYDFSDYDYTEGDIGQDGEI